LNLPTSVFSPMTTGRHLQRIRIERAANLWGDTRMSDKYDIELTRSLKASQPTTESDFDKVLRETQLVGAGFMGVGKAANDAVQPKNIPETVGLGLTAAGLGYGLARLSAAPGPIGLVGKVVATGFIPAFAWNLGVNGKQAWGAISDTWDSDKNWNKNVAT